MSLTTQREKSLQFSTFYVTKEMYEAIKGLPWIEVSKPRNDEGMDIESLKVVGKQFKVGYCGTNGVHQIREAFRFLAESIAGMEKLSLTGGYLVNQYYAEILGDDAEDAD